MNGIDTITARILSEAQAAADAELENARKEADGLLGDYADRAAKLTDGLAEKAKAASDVILERAASSGANLRRNILLEAKSAAIDEAFAAARGELTKKSDAEYGAFFAGLLEKAIASSLADEAEAVRLYGDGEKRPSAFVLSLNETDAARMSKTLLDAGKKALEGSGCTLEMSDAPAQIDGGFLLIRGDVEINGSLAMIFAQLREEMESSIAALLFAG